MTHTSATEFTRTLRSAVLPSADRWGRIVGAVMLPVLCCLSSCSGEGEGPGTSTGGAASDSSGGAVGSGGAVSSGGSLGSGGAGDGSGSGGALGASGGSANTGGSASGGSTASGGADSGAGGTGSGGDSGDPLSSGCGTTFQNPPPKNQQQTLEIQGDPRYYLMDVPSGADNTEPLMLIFALHGFDMNNIAVVNLFNFTERSSGKAITVWPQGEGPHPGTESHWGDEVLKSTWSPNAKNFEFLQTIRSDLGERYCIDQERVFITGFSMGGFFTNSIACEHSDWFRAFAPVAGGGPQNCSNANAKAAIMVQHGTADDIVELSSGEGSRNFWLTQNGCGQGTTSRLNNCAFYEDCPEENPVAWCTGNYEHYIPGEVASNIWSFFSSF